MTYISIDAETSFYLIMKRNSNDDYFEGRTQKKNLSIVSQNNYFPCVVQYCVVSVFCSLDSELLFDTFSYNSQQIMTELTEAFFLSMGP